MNPKIYKGVVSFSIFMTKVTIKGKEFHIIPVKDSYMRRATQYRNNIITILKKIGLSEDYIDIKLENAAMKKIPAKASWYIEGHHLYYSYNGANNYAENLYVVFKVIENEIIALINEDKAIEDFIFEFSEEHDVDEERKKARELLGLSHDTRDLDEINKAYKNMAKDLHPDMPGGDTEKFKELNKAHKVLKRELQ